MWYCKYVVCTANITGYFFASNLCPCEQVYFHWISMFDTLPFLTYPSSGVPLQPIDCRRYGSGAEKDSTLLLDLGQILTSWRFQWFSFSALHLQDFWILWTASFISYMLLPAESPGVPYQWCDARSSQHYHSGACRLQLWDKVKICGFRWWCRK